MTIPKLNGLIFLLLNCSSRIMNQTQIVAVFTFKIKINSEFWGNFKFKDTIIILLAFS
jgi:hypothetical protein